jgi:CBS domain-containing protein
MADDAGSLRTMQKMTASELMTSPVESIRVDSPASEAALRMRELRVSRLLVTDEHGSAAGVISVSDLVVPLGRPSGRRRCVRDVMSHAIVTCLPDTSLEAAARAMTQRRSRSIVVVDDNGLAIGVITGNDLLLLYAPGERGKTVAGLMTTPIITCDADLPLPDAVGLMVKHEVHRLVVIGPDRSDRAPSGVVSTADIVAEMASERSDWQQTPA